MSQTLNVPNHIGFVLDGNRRWAAANDLPIIEGHREGAVTLEKIASAAFKKGVNVVSVFVFSSENWDRGDKEVKPLLGLINGTVRRYMDSLHNEGIRIVIMGRRDGLRHRILKTIHKAEEKTKDNTKGTLALCFNYGGQQEIIDAVKALVGQGLSQDEINEKALSDQLYHPEIPNIDLLIRTSGEQRISNFMLWQAAYSELLFIKKNWPAFNEADLDKALAEFSRRQRRFGK